jgi:DEAD/DEAH box helicase
MTVEDVEQQEQQRQKQQRLAAWRQKQQKATQVSSWKTLSIAPKKASRKRPPLVAFSASVFGEDDDEKPEIAADDAVPLSSNDDTFETLNVLPRKKRRWDASNVPVNEESPVPNELTLLEDSLDQFMEQLQAVSAEEAAPPLGDHIIHFSGSVQQQQFHQSSSSAPSVGPPLKASNTAAIYNPSDWLSDANPEESGGEEDEEKEEENRWALIRALKEEKPTTNLVDAPLSTTVAAAAEEPTTKADQLSFKEQHKMLLHDLAEAAQEVREIEAKGIVDIGREFFQPDDGIVEEAIREYEAAQQQPDSAIWMLNEAHNKKKELASSNPTSASAKKEYPPFVKNIYRVPPAVATLSATAVTNRRAQLKIRVRGLQVPAPVLHFHEMGLPASIEHYMTEQQQITTPYPIQAQCIPCILAGRDVIGIAKTGSGKTLAYVLPMLRHVLVQQEAAASLETKEIGGPVALILVPARELAFQIHSVCKPYAKLLGLK